MKNRSRTEIVSNILDAANGGATKTKIMYIAFLSYNQLKDYLSVLIENNLIEYLDGTCEFRTTEKGLNFLKMHNAVRKLQTTIGNGDELYCISSNCFFLYYLLTADIIFGNSISTAIGVFSIYHFFIDSSSCKLCFNNNIISSCGISLILCVIAIKVSYAIISAPSAIASCFISINSISSGSGLFFLSSVIDFKVSFIIFFIIMVVGGTSFGRSALASVGSPPNFVTICFNLS